jgi:ABC-type enterochelin transport system permease subunit
MNASTRKTVSIVFLCFTLIWFAAILVFEARYLISVFRQQRAFRDALGIIYEEQIEGINIIILVVYLIPGLFAWVMYKRFKKEY